MPTAADRLDHARRLRQAGDLRAAEAVLRELLDAAPADAGAWGLLGNVLEAQNRADEAVAAIDRAVRLRPDDADARSALGLALAGRDRPGDALPHLTRAVELVPRSPSARHNLGVCLAHLGRTDEAAAALRDALRLQPEYPEAHYNLGNVLRDQGRRDDAISHYRRAVELRPLYADVYNNLGLVLLDARQRDEAMVMLRQAARLRPTSPEPVNNLGLAYADLGRFADAERCFQDALRLDPGYADAHANLGTIAMHQGRGAEALAHHRLALAISPETPSFRYNRALALLHAGDYREGFAEYEWRWRRKTQKPRPLPVPRWDGSPLNGKTILLWCEQGLGDAIMFARFAAPVKEHGGTVILECPGIVMQLLTTLAGPDRLQPEGQPLPPVDVHCPLMSLPGLLGTTVGTIPAHVPYLRPEPERVERWASRLPDRSAFRVGVVWQGNPHMAWDQYRSFPLAALEPLADIGGVRLISLQKGPGAEQLAKSRFPVFELGPDRDAGGGAFLDTAAVVEQLDLVVTADTSAAHLAGALGVPVWVALSVVSDWRWLYDRDDTPWYPTMRLFRQTEVGDWMSVFKRMAAELKKLIAARTSPATVQPGPAG